MRYITLCIRKMHHLLFFSFYFFPSFLSHCGFLYLVGLVSPSIQCPHMQLHEQHISYISHFHVGCWEHHVFEHRTRLSPRESFRSLNVPVKYIGICSFLHILSHLYLSRPSSTTPVRRRDVWTISMNSKKKKKRSILQLPLKRQSRASIIKRRDKNINDSHYDVFTCT